MDFETTTRHCPICDADVEVPADLFAGMAQMPKVIARAFKEPHATSGTDGWPPPEIVAPLADIEVGHGWRIRQTLSEDRPELGPLNQATCSPAPAANPPAPSLSARFARSSRLACLIVFLKELNAVSFFFDNLFDSLKGSKN